MSVCVTLLQRNSGECVSQPCECVSQPCECVCVCVCVSQPRVCERESVCVLQHRSGESCIPLQCGVCLTPADCIESSCTV